MSENNKFIIEKLLDQRMCLLKKLENKNDGFSLNSEIWLQCKTEIKNIDEFIKELNNKKQ